MTDDNPYTTDQGDAAHLRQELALVLRSAAMVAATAPKVAMLSFVSVLFQVLGKLSTPDDADRVQGFKAVAWELARMLYDAHQDGIDLQRGDLPSPHDHSDCGCDHVLELTTLDTYLDAATRGDFAAAIGTVEARVRSVDKTDDPLQQEANVILVLCKFLVDPLVMMAVGYLNAGSEITPPYRRYDIP